MVPTRYRRSVSILLLLIMVTNEWACNVWQRHALSSWEVPKHVKGHTLHVVAPTTMGTAVWRVNSPVLTEDSLKGQFERMTADEAHDLLLAERNRELSQHRNAVLLYMRDSLVVSGNLLVPGIPMSSFSRIETIDTNAGATIAMSLLLMTGIAAVIMLIVLLTKSSCPFVYTYNEQGCHLEGEVFSGSVSPQLQRHDRLPLNKLKPVNEKYRIRLSNQAQEIQYTDFAELLVVDHPAGSAVLFDRMGVVRTITSPVQPLRAMDQSGMDATALVTLVDEQAWQGDPKNDRPNADAFLDVSFPIPSGTTSGRLVITARNTFWADQLFGMFMDEFGTKAEVLRERMRERTAEEQINWAKEQYLPLSVSMRLSPDRWEQIGQFELMGPIAWRKDVLEIDLSHIKGDHIELRLGSGFMFWEIDAVTFDASKQVVVSTIALKPDSAINELGANVLSTLLMEDGDHLVQPAVGDATELSFQVPAQVQGSQRSLFLHAAGHYEILRAPKKHEPDMLFLKSFKSPGALSRYSRDRWNALHELSFELSF